MVATGVGRLALAGRADTLAELSITIDAARRGRGGVVVVCGPAGIGKTRLVEEAVERADRLRVLWAWCAGAVPGFVHPWDHIVRTLARDDAEISRMVQRSPALGRRAGDGDRDGGLVDRRQLFDEVADVVVAAARAQPTLIVLDYLHEAGPSSIELLSYLEPQLRGSAALVLATARDDGLSWRGRDRVWSTLLRHARRINLGPLNAADVHGLASQAGFAAPDEVVPIVLARTGGNALLVTELVRDAATGAVPLVDGVPTSIQAIVATRVAPLDGTCRRLLDVAAVVGTSFRLDVVAAVAGVDVGDVRRALLDAEQSRLVAFVDAGLGRFTHDLCVTRSTRRSIRPRGGAGTPPSPMSWPSMPPAVAGSAVARSPSSSCWPAPTVARGR